jgi:branched-chain amino acid transport system permease protein
MIGRVALAIALVGVGLVPWAGRDYYTTLMLPLFGYSIALFGLNLLFGYTGLLSFGHALFLSLGAYAAATLTSLFGLRDLEAVVLAAATTALVVAIPVGLLCVRRVRIYFAMLTLAFGMLFYSFLYKFYALTGGDEGMRVLRPRLLGLAFGHLDTMHFLTGPFYYYALGLLIVAGLVMWRIVHSPFGLCLLAIRENAEKAEAVGIGVRRYRFYAFLIAAVYGGVGGALVAVPTEVADPLLAYWTQSGTLIFMLLLGGFTNFFGPIVGAFAYILLRDQLMSLTQYWRFVLGAILAVLVIAVPRGLMGLTDWGRGPRV